MPIASSVPEFLRARRDEATNTTRRLRDVFDQANHGCITNNQDRLDWLNTTRVMDQPLPDGTGGQPGIRQFLSGATHEAGNSTMSDAELDHIDDWPKDQKERARRALVVAINRPCSIKFRWKLHNGDSEVTDIEDHGAGDIKITFRSPWKNVKLLSADDVTIDEIAVDVGP